MATAIKRRRGTTNEHNTFTGQLAETTIDTDKKVEVVHDGVRAGGFPMQAEIAISVEAFGAKGDSVTDDSAAIQAAINFAIAQVTFAGFPPAIVFKPTVYNVGAAATALSITAPLNIIGNGAQLRYSGTGIALKIAYGNVTVRDLFLSNPTFSFANPASALVGTGIQIYNSGFINLFNVTTTGFAVGRDWYGDGSGVSYSNDHSPSILHCGIQAQFRCSAAGGSYCTHINVLGGSITTGTYSSMVGTRGILIQANGGNIPNGINFFGTACEGNYENKVRTDGIRCMFQGIYWDQTTTGAYDFVFLASSAYNLIIGGNDLGQQRKSDAGTNNIIADPQHGWNFIPVNGNIRIFRTTDPTQYLDISNVGNGIYNLSAGLNHVFEVAGVEVGRIASNGAIVAAGALIAGTGVTAGGNIQTTAGNLACTGTVNTGNPGGGGVWQAWKLGSIVANAVALDATRYVQAEIGGVVVRLALVT